VPFLRVIRTVPRGAKKWLLRVGGIFDTRDTVLMTLKTSHFRWKCAEMIKMHYTEQSRYKFSTHVYHLYYFIPVFLIKTTYVPLHSYQIQFGEILLQVEFRLLRKYDTLDMVPNRTFDVAILNSTLFYMLNS